MRLVKVTLRHFRGVAESTVEFADGVTVVEGPNEVGKSSLVDAIRMIRTTKASSKSSEVKAIQPVGQDVGPEVELELRTGSYELYYRKRWLRQPETVLNIRAPHPAQFSGDEAHQRFEAILDETVDLDLVSALEVLQGGALDQAVLADLPALRSALDESGDAPDGGQDNLLSQIEGEFATYFTPTGRPTGEHRQAEEAVTPLAEKVSNLQARSTEMDQLTEKHARSSARLKELQETQRRAEENLAALQDQIEEVAIRRRGFEEAEHSLSQAKQQLTQATKEREERTTLARDVDERAVQVAELRAHAAQADAAHVEAQKALTEATGACTAARTRRIEATTAARAAATALEAFRTRAEYGALTTRLERAEEAEQQRLVANGTLEAVKADDAAVADLVTLDTEVRVVEAAREAAAAHVLVQALGHDLVTVNGEAVPTGEEHRTFAVHPVRVEVDGVLTVEVLPGAAPADLDQRVTNAKSAFEAALADASVDSLAAAREDADRRRKAAAEAEKAEATLKQLLGDADLGTLRADLAALDARLKDAADEAVNDAELNQDTLANAADAAQRQAGDAEEILRTAEVALDLAREREGTARDSAVRARTAAETAAAEHSRVADALKVARDVAADRTLDEQVEAATTTVGRLEAEEREARDRLAEVDPETLTMQFENASAVADSTRKQREDVQAEVHRLEGQIEDRTKEGIYDQLESARADLEAAEALHRRMQRAAEAVALLRDTMRTHRNAAQLRYVAPFRERIEFLGRGVFGPDLTVEISDDLEIVKRTLAGRTVSFDHLSAGTREQLAIIGRLACAQLVADGGGAPVILDDSLGFSDPDRLRALGAVLNNVGRSAQVVLLTCQPLRYAGVGGAKVVTM